ncbi:MAG: Fic family protein [Candidatus Diapherotrites archaeon]
MAYLREQKVKGNRYFYLVKNVRLRQGGWKQFKRYLGKEPPEKETLEKIIADFEGEVRAKTRSKFEYLANHEVEFVDKINGQFWQRYRELNPSEKADWDRNFLVVFTYNTNSIEGSTLTLKETYKLLEENIAPKKDYDSIAETKAAEKCLNFIKEYKGGFEERFLLELHAKYFNESKPFIAGKYKARPNRVANSKFKTTPPELVRTDMGIFFKEFEKNRKKMHCLELAAWAHWRLEKIHPFQDGNGRIGRLIMNFILHTSHYAMIDIKTQNKHGYYSALEKSDRQASAEPLARLLVKRFIAQYKNALKNTG